jgi:HAMP domain-containing protein
MDDIVTTLRTMVQFTNAVAGDVCWRAADEIETLRNKLAEQEIIHAVQKKNTMTEIERLRAELKAVRGGDR